MVGVGQRRGWFAGAEVNGGPVLQAAVGYQTAANTIYARADLLADPVMLANVKGVSGGGRIGGGYALSLSDETSSGPMFDSGVAVGRPLHEGEVGCSFGSRAAYGPTVLGWDVFVDLRYVGEWEAVVSPRIVGARAICSPY